MNLLQRKCFAASALFHVALVLALFLGVGFRATESAGPVTIVAAPPEEPTPLPASPRAPKDENPASPAGPSESHPASPAPASRSRPAALPRISTTPVSRHPVAPADQPESHASSPPSENPSPGKQISRAIDEALTGLSPANPTRINSITASGNDRISYQEIVKAAYSREWLAPEAAPTSGDGIVRVMIKIARDGRVLSARVNRESGEPAMDVSVRRVLNLVTKLPPFEADASESERTYTINFNLKIRELE